MASLTNSRAQLDQAWHSFSRRWEQTRGVWADQTGAAFEQRYWTPLAGQVPANLQAMQNIGELLDKALAAVRRVGSGSV